MRRIISLALVLALVFTVLVSSVGLAELMSHEVSTNTSHWEHGDDHNIIYAQELYWAFHGKYFCTSADKGVTWSADTDISAGPVTLGGLKTLAVCTDSSGSYVYVAADCYWSGNYAGAFRRGELQGNGTIDWTDWSNISGWHVSSDDHGLNVNIAVDGTGHYWIGHTKYIAYTTNTSYGYIIGSSTTDGTWTTDAAKTLTCYSVGGWVGGTVMPVGLSSTALVVYSCNNGYIYGRKWQTGSSTWSSAVHSMGTCRSYIDGGVTEGHALFSGVGYMDRWVEIVYNRSSDSYLIETYYDSSLDLFAASEYEHVMQTATSTSTWPCISISPLSNNLYVWWIGSPVADHLYYISRNASLVWGYVTDLGVESAGFYDTWHISAVDTTGEDTLAVIYKVDSQKLRFDRLYGNVTGSLPYGIAMDPTDVTATSATLNGLCSWSGGSGANATFHYRQTGMYEDGLVDYGEVDTGEYLNAPVSGLVPSTLTWYWIVFTNESGSYSTNTKFFSTLAGSGYSAPTVITVPADRIMSTSAQINGYLAYDGGLDCYCGFDWRVVGASSWTRSWYSFTNVWPWSTDRPLNSGTSYAGTLSGLAIDTTYEFRALAKNSLTEPGVVYGNTTTFTTLHFSGPTPTGGGGIELPDLPFHINATLKLILAILITLGAVIIVAYRLGRSNAAGVATLGTGVGLVILFTAVGWFPTWIILLIGATVGLLVFFVILGGRK